MPWFENIKNSRILRMKSESSRQRKMNQLRIVAHVDEQSLRFTSSLIGTRQNILIVLEHIEEHIKTSWSFQDVCRFVFDAVLSFCLKILKRNVNTWIEEELETNFKVLKLNCGTWKYRKHEDPCFEMFAKLKGGWPIAKSTRNLIPILLAMLKPCKT